MPYNAFDSNGLLRYRIWIRVEVDDGEDMIAFNALGPVVPRIGEELGFNPRGEEDLSVVVTDVEHNWFLAGDDTATPQTTVWTKPVDHSSKERLTRLWTEPGALKAWVSQFPLLEQTDLYPLYPEP